MTCFEDQKRSVVDEVPKSFIGNLLVQIVIDVRRASVVFSLSKKNLVYEN